MCVKQPSQFRFTQKSVAALPPHAPDSPSREKEYTDLSTAVGLKLLVSKPPKGEGPDGPCRKTFYFRYRFGAGGRSGSRKRAIRIGPFPAVSVSEARERAHEYLNMLSRGIDPQEEKDKRRGEPTFEEFAYQDYLPHAKARKKSWKDDRNKLKADLVPRFGKRRLSEITTKDIQQYHASIRDRGCSVSTANRHLSLARSCLQAAVSWGMLDRNPCEGVKKFKEPKGRTRFLSEAETTRFLAALDESQQRESALAIKLLLLTGMRKMECLSLRWKDNVYLDEGVIRLTPGTTKNGEGRTVYLSSLAQEAVERLAETRRPGSEWVFEGKVPGKHLTTVRKTFEKALQDAGIEHIPLHTLRHTFASHLSNLGVEIRSIQELLGHKNISQTMRYSHLASSTLRAATELAAQNLGQASQRP